MYVEMGTGIDHYLYLTGTSVPEPSSLLLLATVAVWLVAV